MRQATISSGPVVATPSLTPFRCRWNTELSAGVHPCSGKEARDIQKQLLSSKYRFEPASKYNSEVTPEMDRILLKCLRRKPRVRYQSVTEVLLDLSRMGDSRI
jgi:serine/threonine protein kinase